VFFEGNPRFRHRNPISFPGIGTAPDSFVSFILFFYGINLNRMKYLVCLFWFLSVVATAQSPAPVNTAKPWAYWWWMGSAVTEEGIRKNLDDFAGAGLGGLHIIPIYGVKGYEKDFLTFLSPKWNDMLTFTVREAAKRGMGIDLSLGTGWPYGGPWVATADGARKFEFRNDSLQIVPTGQKVKRAAPGGEGLVVNPYDAGAVDRYLAHFTANLPAGNGIRSYYNDSYEVYGANWTNDFAAEFQRRRGYRLPVSVLQKKKDLSEDDRRMWADYHTTFSELLHDRFTKQWTDWTRTQGKVTRDQAHGSPANILDLYAVADIPETEYFGSKQYRIPGYRLDKAYDSTRFGVPGTLTMQFASSAAHLTGRPLVSSETSTWLGEHFRVSLSQIKPIVDELFTGGVNHIFYHGIPYSPPGEKWPGWLFYASTNYNQQSHFWKDLPELNRYITECQTRLQAAKPDAQVLLYFPIQDIWHGVAAGEAPFLFDVHANSRRWLNDTPFGATASHLRQAGYQTDFVSDHLLESFSVKEGKLVSGGGASYRVLVVPAAEFLPDETLRTLERLAKAGARILFEQDIPAKTAGYRRDEQAFKTRREALRPLVTIRPDVISGLAGLGVKAERLRGLSFIRKKNAEGTIYFITNLSDSFHRGPIRLATTGLSAQLFDPLHGRAGYVPVAQQADSTLSLELALEPGESIFIQTYPSRRKGIPWPETPVFKDSLNLTGIWQIDFLEGEPKMPPALGTSRLVSWTELDHVESEAFSGTARYTLSFRLPAAWKGQKDGYIDLGEVRESAVVRLNDQVVGKTWCLPHRLRLPSGLLKAENKLEVDVTNLSANRIRALDAEKFPWRKFYDINFVSIRYEPFDASTWEPEPSGLLGPVVLRR
jgi:hypothetical protein